VPDGVYASVHDMEAATMKPMLDRAPAEPEAFKLCAGNHPVLTVG
jgi:hypothetical protein